MASLIKINNSNYQVSIPLLTTASAANSKTKTCIDANEQLENENLSDGTSILLKLSMGNSHSSPILSINGGTGKLIVGNASARPSQYNYEDAIMHLVYDGTNWIIVG